MNPKVQTALLTVIPLLFFALISTFVPPNWTFIVFFIYAIVFTSLAMVLPRITTRKRIVEMKGTTIIKSNERDAMKLIMKDVELNNELKSQALGVILLIIAPFIIWFAVSSTLYSVLIPQNREGIQIVELFIRYLIFYGVLMAIFQMLRFVITPKKMIIPVHRYEIMNIGIKISDNIFTSFPLDKKRYIVTVNPKRGFVEIYDKSSKQAFRLYSSDPQKVYSVIEKYGLVK